jgi:uncharacterized protein YqgC (DUF456 family)
MARTYGLGAGLIGVGAQQKGDAMNMLGQAADAENARNIANKQIEAQDKASKAQTGATAGALAGMYTFGPVGAVVGGLAGAVIGGLF